MKQTRVTPINGGPTSVSTQNAAQSNDLIWVDEVAALLPDDLRLGWYRNVKPWISTLPPEDEVAHLAYSMGYLALLIRNTPALVAAERAKLTPILQQLSREAYESLNSAAAYHHRLEERLGQLPTAIAHGINTAEFVATITREVRNQFSKSGLPETGRLLQEQGERLRRLASEQSRALLELEVSMGSTTKTAKASLEAVETASCRTKDSIELWNREMRWVQWLHHGLALLVGLLLGCLLYWWIWGPEQTTPLPQKPPAQHSQPFFDAPPTKPPHAHK